MDSPRLPEASSPVVLPPPYPHGVYNIERPGVVANNSRRTITSRLRTVEPQLARTIGGVSTSTSASRSTSVLRPFHSSTAAAGPTTRSRKRTSRTVREAGAFPTIARTVRVPGVFPAAAPFRTQNSVRERSTARTATAAYAVAGSSTTAVRSRTQSSVRERSTSRASTAVPASVAVPSRKRKSPASSSERRKKAPRTASNRKKPPPGSDLKMAPPRTGKCTKDEDKKPAAKCDCCICMEAVEPKDVAKIDGCDHRFCFGCIEKWSERENKCPLCKARFTKIDRIQKKYTKGYKNTKKVKQKDQRPDISSGTALEGLLANLHRNSGSLARIIFGNMEFGPAAAISTSRSASGIHAHFADDSEDSDDDSPMAAFMRALHGSSGASGIHMSTTVMRPISVTTTFSHTTRSFARNVHDSTAGSGADNPLEIDDDSVEEVIEIE